jgi:DNA-binding winged helix-turn-helix (wHTH) protein/tetratricopeptide (TPR) repeat protein
MKEFPPFRMDTVNQCIWRRNESGNDDRILLRPTAFAILRYLVDHAGRLVTPEEILDAVWHDTYVQPDVLKRHVFDIRNQLGDDPKVPRYIGTLPRRGYQFIADVRDAASTEPAAADTPAQTKLVGQDRALGELRSYLGRALGGRRQIVFVTGEPGIGKTTLVDEFQLQACRQQAGASTPIRIARGQCVEGYGGKEAYYPMLQALGDLCRGPGGDPVVQALAAHAPTWLVQFPSLVKRHQRETLRREILGATRERMLREIGDALETIASETTLLLILEDLQWVDHSTIDLISALARGREPAKLLFVATYRPSEVSLSEHPLKRVKEDLLVHRLCHELPMQPLGEKEIAAYLAFDAPGAQLPQGLAALFHRHSEGNPLFLVAALEHLMQRRFLSLDHGIWKLNVAIEEIDIEAPESLRQMIDIQLERLSGEERRALEVASVSGVLFSTGVSAGAADMDAEAFEHLCGELSRRHQIVRLAPSEEFQDPAAGERYGFVHALYREVLYQRQSPGRRAKLHLDIAGRLEWLYAERLSEAAPELAHHFEQGGDWPRAIQYLRVEAGTAQRRLAPRQAVALLEHAFDLAINLPEAERATSEIGILEALASIYYMSLDANGPDTYQALASRANQYGAIGVEVGALIQMATVWTSGDSQRAIPLLERALQLSARQADPVARAMSRMQCSYWRIMAGEWNQEDASAGLSAFSEIRLAAARPALGPYLIWYSGLLLFGSEYRESRRNALEGLAVLTEGSDGNPCATLPQVNATFNLYFACLFLGQWGEALREVEACIAALAKNANDVFAHGWLFWRALLNIFAMDFAGALSICESAVSALGDAIIPPSRRMYLAMAGTAEVALGQHERALEHLSLARAEMERQMVTNDWYCRLFVESALTELWIGKGEVVQARLQAERFLGVTLTTAERTWQALAWEANARVALIELDGVRAQDCITKALSAMEGFDAPLAAWRVHASAFELYRYLGDQNLAECHRVRSRDIIMKLANSLPLEEPLQRIFLSTPMVRKILGEQESA